MRDISNSFLSLIRTRAYLPTNGSLVEARGARAEAVDPVHGQGHELARGVAVGEGSVGGGGVVSRPGENSLFDIFVIRVRLFEGVANRNSFSVLFHEQRTDLSALSGDRHILDLSVYF